jgi:hypothetical protein
MARTDLERFDDTRAYLAGIDNGLAQDVDLRVQSSAMSKGEIGRALSLEGIWSKGHLYRGQHRALRALMLCQTLYLQPPWARKEVFARGAQNQDGSYDTVGGQYQPYFLAWKLDVPTSVVRNLSEDTIAEMVRCYVTRPNARPDDLAQVAEGNVVEGAEPDYRTARRDGPSEFGNMCVCYDAVRAWLFKAGFVSMRWLTHEGPSLIARTANAMLGDGVVVAEDRVEHIPRGWIFNFHGGNAQGRDNKDVCHWGVSLGNGIGAATNTTEAEGDKRVNFIRGAGPARYGVFRLKQSYEVCKVKYGGDAVIRQIDPLTVPGLY